MTAIRVLHAVKTMNLGGIESFIMNQYRCIDREKVQFDFLIQREAESYYENEIVNKGGRVFRIPSFDPLHHKRFIDALDLFFAEHPEYQIVHTVGVLGMYTLRAAQKAGVPIRIAHAQSALTVEKNHKMLFQIYAKRKLNRFCTHRFACGLESAISLFGKNAEKLDGFKLIPNAIDAARFRYSPALRESKRKELGLDEKIVFGMLGRFYRVKNHSFMIDVFKIIHEKMPNSVLLLIGDGPTRQKLEKKAAHCALMDHIHFMGFRSDTEELLQAIDVFTLTSLAEGVPLAGIEAQAAGLQCFASTNVPHESKMTDLFQFIDLKEGAAGWAEKILQRLEYERKDTYDEICSAGYDITILAREMASFYLACVDHKRR